MYIHVYTCTCLGLTMFCVCRWPTIEWRRTVEGWRGGSAWPSASWGTPPSCSWVRHARTYAHTNTQTLTRACVPQTSLQLVWIPAFVATSGTWSCARSRTASPSWQHTPWRRQTYWETTLPSWLAASSGQWQPLMHYTGTCTHTCGTL